MPGYLQINGSAVGANAVDDHRPASRIVISAIEQIAHTKLKIEGRRQLDRRNVDLT